MPALPAAAVCALAWVERFDREVLHWINCDLHSPGFQRVLEVLQDKWVGVPLVLLLLVVVARVRGAHVARRSLVACLLAFLVGWQVAELLWRTIERPRPPASAAVVLRTPEEAATCAAHPDAVVMRRYASHRPGFPSQHAMHSAAFATVLWLGWAPLGWIAALYALMVAVARVHAGVHWPTDVLAGSALGPLLAWGAWRLVPHLLGLVGRRRWVEPPAADAPAGDDASG